MIKKVISVVGVIAIISMNIIAPPENVYGDNLSKEMSRKTGGSRCLTILTMQII